MTICLEKKFTTIFDNGLSKKMKKLAIDLDRNADDLY